MNLTVNIEEFNLLRKLIRDECGIELSENKMYLIEGRLTQIVVESGCQSFMEFYQKAASNTDPTLREKIVDAITTNETLWFRDQSPFATLTEVLFPELFKRLSEGKDLGLHIWSAACSTGQEPYSIAMLADQFANAHGYSRFLKQVKILGTDICGSALMLARLARYDTLSMSRGMPEELKTQYFTQQGSVSVLKPEIKSMVTFKKFNIMNSFDELGHFHIVFLRNVAIYFSDNVKKELLNKIPGVLHPDGCLFLGSAEFFQNSREHFETHNHERCSYYRLNNKLRDNALSSQKKRDDALKLSEETLP